MALLGSTYRTYLLLVIGPIAALGAACFVVALGLEPLSNDLTRLGGYPEREFGWNEPQYGFRPPLVPVGTPADRPEVVVIGDSFSISKYDAPGATRTDYGYWTDFFRQKTGLTLSTFHRDLIAPEAYIGSDAFKTSPPRLLIVEVAERVLPGLPSAGAKCPAPSPAVPYALSVNPLDRRLLAQRRDTEPKLDAAGFDSAIDLIVKSVPRALFGLNRTEVIRLPMNTDKLFSSQRSDQLLIYKGDLLTAAVTPNQEIELTCYVRGLQAAAEANRYTSFVFLIAPDKSTTYSAYMKEPLGLPNLIEGFTQDADLHLVRLDLPMRKAAAEGRRDIYLPSDTHWGWAGKEIAADTLIGYLAAEH